MAKTKKPSLKKKAARRKPASRRAKDLPATYGALSQVRGELKSDIATVRFEMKAGFKAVDARFKSVDARFNQVDAQFKKIDAQLAEMNGQLQKMNADMHRMLTLHEEQNSRNKASFEGAEHVRLKQDQLESRVDALESWQHACSR